MRSALDPRAMEDSRASYREHCASTHDLPLFSRSWMLDCQAPESWGAALVRDKGGRVTASMPFTFRRTKGLWISSTPNLLPRLGPWFSEELRGATSTKTISRRHQALEALAQQIPAFDHFSQNWNPQSGDWLALHWAGYRETTFYTYRLDLGAIDDLWTHVDGSVRTEIRKARDRHGLTADPQGDLEAFLDLNSLVFERQGLDVPYAREHVRQLARVTKSHANASTVVVSDEEERPHAGAFVVHDDACAYYLLGGADPALRASGAGYLALWSALEEASGRVATFDFEGSMIKPIERFFRQFGAEQVPYHSITRTRSRLLRTAMALRD